MSTQASEVAMTATKRIAEAIRAHKSYIVGDRFEVVTMGEMSTDLESDYTLTHSDVLQSLPGVAAVMKTFTAPCVFLLVERTNATVIIRARREHFGPKAAAWKIETLDPHALLAWILPPVSPFDGLPLSGYGWDILGYLSDPDLKPEDMSAEYEPFKEEIELLLTLVNKDNLLSVRAQAAQAAGMHALVQMLNADAER